MKFQSLLNKILIQENLTLAQKYLVDTFTNARTVKDFGPIFKEQRTYFELQKKEIEELAIPENIKQEIDKAGFYITDYRAGIAMKKDKTDLRQIKLGKILNRLNKPELTKQFNERLGTSKKVIEKLNICITYNPYDVAGMSTDRNWTSCMELDVGEYCETPLYQVKYGGMCAYLIKESDKNIDQPLARIAIKRLIDKENINFMFKQETRVYGDEDLAKEVNFQGQVEKILDKSNELTMKDTFEFQRDEMDDSYSDGDLVYGFNKKLFNLNKISFNDLQRYVESTKLTETECQQILNKYPFTNIARTILIFQTLSEQFIFKNLKYFTEYLNSLWCYQSLSEKGIEKLIHLNMANWTLISAYQKLSLNFMRKYQNQLDWKIISGHQKITEELINEFKDKISWFSISINKNKISESLIRKYINEFKKHNALDLLLHNQKNLNENFKKEMQNQ